jgi:hypothetical protein
MVYETAINVRHALAKRAMLAKSAVTLEFMAKLAPIAGMTEGNANQDSARRGRVERLRLLMHPLL